MLFLKQHAKNLTLLLVFAVGIIIASPYRNFQVNLAQGDHGRELYAAQAVYRGELPYKDFWWDYGPLMPYYYGLFLKILGNNISSVLLGKAVLQVAAGVLVYLAMSQAASSTAACLCACWFMLFHQDFFYTYNHIGGIVMVLGVCLCLLSYIKNNSLKAAWGALGFIFILCLIKINFGLAALAVALITVGACDAIQGVGVDGAKKHFYAAALIGVPLAVFIIYWSLLRGLTAVEIRQCLHYWQANQPYRVTPWGPISDFLQITWHTITSTKVNFVIALIINASALRCFYLFAKNKLPLPRRQSLLLSLGLLCLFFMANFHEYLASGVLYRAFWAQPFSMMVSFLLIDIACQSVPQFMRIVIFSFMALQVIDGTSSEWAVANAYKTKDQFLSLPRGQVYLTNDTAWIATVEKTTEFLNKTLKPHELFLALPYDCLYYYLTDKKSPTRQLIFFDHINITAQQERSVIAELEKNHVDYVLLSNRAFAPQQRGLGTLGASYCPLIGKYISDHFVAVARFGDWRDEPGWAWNHGTLILKRKGNY